ncbi:VanZ family protein [Paenibacillus sp. y28]|uniref:VanZ family protein n=1 Tax=Paenibacillus sp. y28 TaxID=3129110 RepID=UPI00301B46E8
MEKLHIAEKKALYYGCIGLCLIYTLIMMKLLFFRGSGYRWETYNYNLIPFKTILNDIRHMHAGQIEMGFKNLAGNLVLFLPMGVFAPLLGRRWRRFGPFAGFSLAVLVSIELIQLCTRVGTLDVDDVMLNFIGALLGFVTLPRLIRIKNRGG